MMDLRTASERKGGNALCRSAVEHCFLTAGVKGFYESGGLADAGNVDKLAACRTNTRDRGGLLKVGEISYLNVISWE